MTGFNFEFWPERPNERSEVEASYEVEGEQGVIEDFNKWREEEGLPPIKPESRKRSRSMSLSDEAYEGLRMLANQFECKPDRGRGEGVSKLVEEIGCFRIKLS